MKVFLGRLTGIQESGIRRCQEINATITWIASLHSQGREGRHCERSEAIQ
ncbi:MAG: hypothetical protein LBS88_12800 [Tannerellaceae bacterium]|nr:hypothetical protein [Tannerellaceae bacterium]